MPASDGNAKPDEQRPDGFDSIWRTSQVRPEKGKDSRRLRGAVVCGPLSGKTATAGPLCISPQRQHTVACASLLSPELGCLATGRTVNARSFSLLILPTQVGGQNARRGVLLDSTASYLEGSSLLPELLPI